jgi:hypothetical protein
LIKAYIPPEFLLEWFLKSLLPYISKDVSTSRVTSEEEAIFKSQQLDLIYAQSGMLYEILPDAPRSNYDPRQNPGPHVDGIVGSVNVKSTDSVTSHLKDLSLNQSVGGPTSSVSSNPTQSVMYILCNHRPTRMVTNNQEGIKRKDVIIIVRVGRIIINPRTMVIMRRQ